MNYTVNIKKTPVSAILFLCLLFITFSQVNSADNTWMAIGDLRSWYSSGGCEIEVGRTFETKTQQDGLQWPAQFRNQDTEAAKALWIGCKNYNDPAAGRPFDYKVVHAGPRLLDENNEFIPQVFKMYGKFEHPLVTVDGEAATELDYLEDIDTGEDPGAINPNLISDRMLLNVVNTGIGLTMTRRIYAWGNQNHSNYFIYEYVFTNTGIYDKDGSAHNQTLNDVLFHWQYRYAVAKEACAYGGYWLPQNATWGRNTVNDQTGHGLGPRAATARNAPRPNSTLRTLFSWCGNHSGWSPSVNNIGTMIGAPKYGGDGHLGASQFVGTVVLFADDPNNIGSDSPDQPSSTYHFDSDDALASGNSAFNAAKMQAEYFFMNSGYPTPVHADAVGDNNADEWGISGGGYSQTHTFGPYTIAHGDSIKIVLAEAVAGLNRDSVYSVGANWLNWANGNSGTYTLPGGSTTDDGDAYKNAWVFTGVDSLFKTFERAKDNYDNYFSQGLPIASPPLPPAQFAVNTGGDRVVLTWSNESEATHFAGYNIYRAKFKPDTTYELIKTINGSGVYRYDDLSPQRGFDYFYYITAFDDGTVDPGGNVLESSKFYTMTSAPAFLKRLAGTNLNDIRIVPNPYNISARKIQFGANGPGEDRIMFYNIPKICRIKIFTERGDLIKTIEHTDGSGDQEWKQLTSSRQVVVSGLYIAHIEVLEDQYDEDKLVLKKGDSVIKKFIIIR